MAEMLYRRRRLLQKKQQTEEVLEAVAKLRGCWTTLLEVQQSSREGLEAGAALECPVDVGAEVRQRTETEQVHGASTTVARGLNKSGAFLWSSGEDPKLRQRSGTLDPRQRLTGLVEEDDYATATI